MRKIPRKQLEKNQPKPRKSQPDATISAAQPENFDKTTTPRRERMARDIMETSPEERMKQGR